MQYNNVLVLAGGSVKAAYQVGVIKALFKSGFRPQKIYGISAGSLNASFICNYLGKKATKNEQIDYNDAADALANFWIENINKPETLARRRGTYELGMSAVRRNFEGLLDTQPLKEMIYENIKIKYLRNSPVELEIGAVDIQSGQTVYVSPVDDHFHDYILASSAIPILMPVINIGDNKNKAFLDGGLREVAPIKKAIIDGAQKIVCVACHTGIMEAGEFPYGNLLALVDRIMDITVNESLNNDLEWAQLYIKANAPQVNLEIIRPQKYLKIDIQSFNGADIERIIETGFIDATYLLNHKL